MKRFAISALFGLVMSFFGQTQLQAQGWEPISRPQAAKIVKDVYSAFLYQKPGARDLDYWQNRIANGSYPVITDELAPAIAKSARFSEVVKNYGTRDVIDNVYQDLFGRPAGKAGYDAWASYVDRQNYKAFVFGVLASVEFQQTYGIRLY